ncbi:hypothetical protein CGRA01v4_06611 [Colletotrichum graminicola]|nr:hypothetical protein CGRA01v4_06611 [Colletotrichum graminicola]
MCFASLCKGSISPGFPLCLCLCLSIAIRRAVFLVIWATTSNMHMRPGRPPARRGGLCGSLLQCNHTKRVFCLPQR